MPARAGDLLEEMRDAEGDQQQFADLSKRLITVLQSEMGDTAENNEDGNDADDGSQDNNEDGQSDEAQSATGEDDTSDEDGQSLEQDGDAAGMASEDAAEMESDSDMDGMTDGETPGGEPGESSYKTQQNENPYKIFTTEFDEVVDASDLCDPAGHSRLASCLPGFA